MMDMRLIREGPRNDLDSPVVAKCMGGGWLVVAHGSVLHLRQG